MLHTLSWLAGVLATFAFIGAAYAYDVLENTGAAGLLVLLGLVFASQWWRLRRFLRRVDDARG